ncbi:EpsG family protein [Paenibacillus harenae]|uniref:EpsG family protein n=1 Tax=Paenibacillus harenae TaxID=306543 RepID=UPI00048F0493|nr:EpsG family protein [Paenibacillus harenae]
MTILWLSLLVVFLCAIFARYFSVSTSAGLTSIQPNKVLAAGAALTLVLVAGLRNNIGDTVFYIHSYRVDDFSWGSIIQKKDIGFGLLQMLLKQISNDPQILLFVTAMITNLLIVAVLYKYSRQLDLSLYIYITSGAFIVSMNGVRQFLAAAMVFAVTKSLFDGKWKTYMLVVLFASFIHQSALIMIPLYFIVRRKAWTGVTFLFLFLAILVVMGFQQFSELLFSALKDTQYGDYASFEEGGASVLRVIVLGLPLIIAFLGREKLRLIFPKSDIIVNLTIVGFALMVISTQNWIFARMNIYFSLYQLILIGWLVKVFRPKDQKFIYLAILVFYFLYFYFENEMILGLRYTSDYLVWPF